MEKLNSLIEQFELLCLIEDSMDELSHKIYGELIEDGCLPSELLDDNIVADMLLVDYEYEFTSQETLERLVDEIIDEAMFDSVPFADEEDLEEANAGVINLLDYFSKIFGTAEPDEDDDDPCEGCNGCDEDEEEDDLGQCENCHGCDVDEDDEIDQCEGCHGCDEDDDYDSEDDCRDTDEDDVEENHLYFLRIIEMNFHEEYRREGDYPHIFKTLDEITSYVESVAIEESLENIRTGEDKDLGIMPILDAVDTFDALGTMGEAGELLQDEIPDDAVAVISIMTTNKTRDYLLKAVMFAVIEIEG
jgi:hypothetical protein